MKLQRFIENYRKDRGERGGQGQGHSPDRSGVFRTSESVGTLNSRDEFATDRSFAIKEIPIHQPHSHKKQNTQEVEMLRDLCASERPQGSPFEKVSSRQIEEFTCHSQPFSFPQGEGAVLGTTFSKSNKTEFHRPNFSFRPPLQQQNEELYQEAPSQVFESKPQNKMALLLSREEQLFLGQLQALVVRVSKLQAENLQLEQRWLEQEQISLKYQRGCGILQQQVAVLKERVTATIQQNIQIENMIKETLLKQEMQKYHCFTKEESRRVLRKEDSLPPVPRGKVVL